jgi:hypothetical protein
MQLWVGMLKEQLGILGVNLDQIEIEIF